MNPKDLIDRVNSLKQRQAAAHGVPPGYVLFDDKGEISKVGVGAFAIVEKVPDGFVGRTTNGPDGILLRSSDE